MRSSERLHIALFVNSLIFFVTILFSCSGSSNEVGIEGRMLHMHQAAFYVYSTDGTIEGIDTINVHGGRFEFDKEITHEGTFVIVFPNFTQIPVFVEPGASISIEGDAARLREISIEGTSANKTYTEFREENLDKSAKEMRKVVADRISTEDDDCRMSLWLLQQYYLTASNPDIKGAMKLLKVLRQKHPDNVRVKRMTNLLTANGIISEGDKVVSFRTTDINGNVVNNSLLNKGVSIVMTCASWNYDSQSMLRRLAMRQRGIYSDDSKAQKVDNVIAISLDADREKARRMQSDCDASGVIMICDTLLWDNPLLRTFGLTTLPQNIVIENGKVTKRNIPTGKL